MIQLFHVSKEYPGDGLALQDVSLEVEKGEFVFLTGASGAGKSTLLKLIFCDEPATSGQLLLFGKNVAKIRPAAIPYVRRNIGVVFQDFKLLPLRTVAENVALPLEVRGMPEKELKKKVMGLLRSVGLEYKAGKLPPALSGGDLALLPRVPGVRAVAFLRRGGGETVLVVHNLGATPVDLPSLAAPGASAEPVFVDAGASLVREEGGWRARLAPRSTAAWRVR